MQKWPMNNHIGSATRRYFILNKDTVSYHKQPPTYFESCIATPYALRYDNPDIDSKLNELHITPHSRVAAHKKQLVFSCLAIRYVYNMYVLDGI